MNGRLLDYLRPLVLRFWEICLLRVGPERIPYSPVLLVILLLLAYLVDTARINLLLPELPVSTSLWVLLIHTMLMLLVTGLLLGLFGYKSRVVQTLTALTGTGIILSLLILPFDFITSMNPKSFTMASLFTFFFQIWSLVIVGHILSSALSVPRLTGVIIAIGYFILGLAAFRYLLPSST
jgi:hypothetical protein